MNTAGVDPVSYSSVRKNNTALLKIRHTVALVTGCVAGALRLEFLGGLSFYLLLWAISSLVVIAVSGNPSYYFTSSKRSILTSGIMMSFPGFLLAWSLVYSLVET
ncbi:hypothetical protein DASB73_023420 [Starmerella bacillaris]|uniref:ER membrane protein complex subunit 6 n=1 Tax=Starmerella bacillaris TaxID=1247836 RepID=A0AAV5RIH5_STABA|nr:hypothetical protein DASB73_023420 [Starmerella bacillaris]